MWSILDWVIPRYRNMVYSAQRPRAEAGRGKKSGTKFRSQAIGQVAWARFRVVSELVDEVVDDPHSCSGVTVDDDRVTWIEEIATVSTVSSATSTTYRRRGYARNGNLACTSQFVDGRGWVYVDEGNSG